MPFEVLTVGRVGISNTFFLFVVAGVASLTFVKLCVPEI
jgi:major inositol transporter-like SP family MFS transporter